MNLPGEAEGRWHSLPGPSRRNSRGVGGDPYMKQCGEKSSGPEMVGEIRNSGQNDWNSLRR
jgi:hypothetical protein